MASISRPTGPVWARCTRRWWQSMNGLASVCQGGTPGMKSFPASIANMAGAEGQRGATCEAAAARAVIDGAARRHGAAAGCAGSAGWAYGPAREAIGDSGSSPPLRRSAAHRSALPPSRPDTSVSGRNREGTGPDRPQLATQASAAMWASQPLIVTACATMPLLGPLFKRHLQHRVECRLVPVPAIEQQGVVGALGNRVVVLP